jgi:hypothetical protein
LRQFREPAFFLNGTTDLHGLFSLFSMEPAT